MNTKSLLGFIGLNQLTCIVDGLVGEEAGCFQEIVDRMAETIVETPVTYEQDVKGDGAIAFLHYFIRGYDFYLTEKDAGGPNDTPSDFQNQTFGLVILNGSMEMGYVSLPEILSAGAELDLHFTPTPLSQIKAMPRYAHAA